LYRQLIDFTAPQDHCAISKVITWDERKRLSNIDKHGLDFGSLTPEFFEHAHVGPAKKGRLYALSPLGDDILVVFFVPLGAEAISVVSMRVASKKERQDAR
jgi:uncharacterized DUF497 family protein